MPSVLLDFTDKPQQKAFFLNKRDKSIGAGGGYNSGKSYAMIAKIQFLLEVFSGSTAIVGRKTYSALEKSVIPTYEKIALARNGGKWNGPVINKFSDLTAYFNNGSKLWFVTYDDVKKVRGPNIAYAGISQAEEVAHEIFLELKGRCRQWNPDSIAEWRSKNESRVMKEFGWKSAVPFNQLMCEFNPAPNWVRDEFYFNEAGSNKFYNIPTIENKKYHADGWMDDLKRSYTKENYDRFINGSWDVFGGMVYPEFDIRELHGIPSMVIPDHWPRIVGWDHGYRNPTAIEIGAIDEVGNIIIYKEHYQDGLTVKENANAYKELVKDDKMPIGADDRFLVFMDYAVKGQYDKDGKTIWDEYMEQGIYGLKPDKDVNAGINMVKQYLKTDPQRAYPKWHSRAGQFGSPKLFIVRNTCTNLINEMQTYQWEETKEEQAHQEKPKKWNDHGCDGLRYLCMAVGKNMAEWIKEAPTKEQVGREAAIAIAKAAFTRHEDQLEEPLW